jgi:hypothetical protein
MKTCFLDNRFWVRQSTGKGVGTKPQDLIGSCCTHMMKDNCLVIGNKDKAVKKIYKECMMR